MIEHKLEVVGTALNGAEDEWSVDGILTSTVSAESILSGKIDPFIEQIMAHVTGFDERKKKWDTQAERRKAKTSGLTTTMMISTPSYPMRRSAAHALKQQQPQQPPQRLLLLLAQSHHPPPRSLLLQR
jgi:hypothetical protein